VAKRTVEHYLQYYQKEYGLETISLRYANVYGPRQNAQGEAGVVAIFCSRLIHTLPLVINGDGRQTRDYVYVADVVDANIRALRVQGSGAYNIGTGVETSVNELAKRLRAVARVAAPVVHGPAKHGEQRRSVLDCKRATRALGWKPRVSLEYGLAKTFRWFQENA
jgi:UDP-glucose 4-epimerase